MSNQAWPPSEATSDTTADAELNDADSSDSKSKSSRDRHDYERGRNPDTELHLDRESDTLYSDGIDVEENFDTWVGTDGSSGRIP